MLQSNSLSLTG